MAESGTSVEIWSVWKNFRSKTKDLHNAMKIWHPCYGFMTKVQWAARGNEEFKKMMVDLPGYPQKQLYLTKGKKTKDDYEYDKTEIAAAQTRIIQMQIIAMNAVTEGFIHELFLEVFRQSPNINNWETYKATLESKQIKIACADVRALCAYIYSLQDPPVTLPVMTKKQLIINIEKASVDPDNLVREKFVPSLAEFHMKQCAVTSLMWRDVCEMCRYLLGNGRTNFTEKMREFLLGDGNQGMPLQFPAQGGPFKRFRICIMDCDTLNNITRLFYGLRCLLSHGNPEPTLRSTGALGQQAESVHWDIEARCRFEKSVGGTKEIYLYGSEQADARTSCIDYLRRVWNEASTNEVAYDFHLYTNAHQFFMHYGNLLHKFAQSVLPTAPAHSLR